MYGAQGSLALPSFDPPKGRNPEGGRSFFVRASSVTGHIVASDDNEGTDPQYPLQTIQAALDKCVASIGDYVFVLYHSAIDSPPLTIPVRTIHLISMSHGGFDSRNDLNGGAEAAISITSAGRDFELAGFNLGGAGADEGILADSGEVMYRCHIHHCTFGMNYGVTNGIGAWSLSQSVIDNCVFGSNAEIVSGDGINVGDFTNSYIMHCLFSFIADRGIDILAANGGSIHENMFYSPIAEAEDGGWGITIRGGSHCLVMKNVGSASGNDEGENPFLDLSTGTVTDTQNGWALNYHGESLVDPDVVQ